MQNKQLLYTCVLCVVCCAGCSSQMVFIVSIIASKTNDDHMLDSSYHSIQIMSRLACSWHIIKSSLINLPIVLYSHCLVGKFCIIFYTLHLLSTHKTLLLFHRGCWHCFIMFIFCMDGDVIHNIKNERYCKNIN